ncbi:DUF5953 family protein [Myxococcus vastator]|uniref:DUF5953 family protein n=1 Tax=Myxococcus vastator TaxID=2709664 RepID=UPI0013D76BAB|nr:DUF5953 family protein [Myxococcus vastator]
MTTRNRLVLNVYASALTENDGRPLAAVHGLERASPGLSMAWKVSKNGQLIALPNRDSWLAEAVALGEFPLVCNGDESYPVTIVGRHQLASESPGGQPQLQVHAKLPQDTATVAVAADVLEQVAEGIRALWGLVAPGGVMEVIADQTGPKRYGPSEPPLGLPALKMPWNIRSPETPRHLGWLNYWSAAAAKAIGFPDPTRDTDLLSRSRRTASGGWVVQLTDAPLDLDSSTHLDALKRAYARFPEIGGRSAP